MNKKTLLGLSFTLIYIFCEIIYNLGLVEFLTSKNTEIQTFEMLENFGKLLSSIGFTLVVCHFIKNIKYKFICLAIMIPTCFIAESVGFRHLVNNLSNEKKVAGYIAAAYRNGVINEKITDTRFSILNSYNKVVLSNILLFVDDEKNMHAKVKDVLHAKDGKDTSMELFKNYEKLNAVIDPYYASYATQSKKWSGWTGKKKELIDKEFIKRSGMKQGLNKQEFLQAVATKSPSLDRYNKTVFIQGNDKLGIKELKGVDIPLGMSESQFQSFITAKKNEVLAKSNISTSNIDALPHSYDLIASVFIPPIAIFLSLMSIIFNTSLLFIELTSFVQSKYRAVLKIVLGAIPGTIALFVLMSYTHNPFSLKTLPASAIGLESSMVQSLDLISKGLHSVFINDVAPDDTKIMRITSVEAINFSDIEKSLGDLDNMNMEGMPEADKRLTVDSEKMEHDQGYYGEVKTSINPYTGKPY